MQTDNGRRIPPPIEPDEYVWAAAAYVFWPILWLPLMFSPRRDVAYVRFHVFQGLGFGALTSLLFMIFTALVLVFFRSAGTQAAAWMGLVFVGLFAAWLVALFALFLAFLYLAHRAFQGDVVKVPLVGGFVEARVLEAEVA